MIVDEHSPSAEDLEKLLSGWGCGVTVYNSGRRAVAWAREHRTQVALVSLNLLGGEVAHQLRCGKEPRSLVLISLSHEEQNLDRARANALGFDFHLIKPVDTEEFRRALLQMARDENLWAAVDC